MHKCPTCGKDNRIVNECRCDPDNLPTQADFDRCPWCGVPVGMEKAVYDSGYGIMSAGGKLSIYPVSEAAKKAEEVEGRLIADNIDLTLVLEKTLSWLTSYPGGGAIPMYDECRRVLERCKR